MPKFVVTSFEFTVQRSFFIVIFLAAFFSSFVTPSYAQSLTREECFQDTIAKLGCLPFYLGNIINGLFALSAVAAIILIIISGIRLLTSGGDATRVAKARTSLYYSIIGFVIVLCSFLILRVISFITGAECINALGFDTCN